MEANFEDKAFVLGGRLIAFSRHPLIVNGNRHTGITASLPPLVPLPLSRNDNLLLSEPATMRSLCSPFLPPYIRGRPVFSTPHSLFLLLVDVVQAPLLAVPPFSVSVIRLSRVLHYFLSTF